MVEVVTFGSTKKKRIMETKKIPYIVYAESTPNPATMKYVANKLLIENGATVEYSDPDFATECPLAIELFNFPFVDNIFISGNFITITKTNVIEWEDVNLELREFILNYLNSGKTVFTTAPTQTQHASTTVASEQPTFLSLDAQPANATEEQIINLLEEYIRPAVESDGGAIHFKSFEEESGKLTVTLRGACSGCPSSSITLKNGIQSLFQRMMPQVTEVVAEEL